MPERNTDRALRRVPFAVLILFACATVYGYPERFPDDELRTRANQAILANWEGVTEIAMTATYDLPELKALKWKLPTGGEIVVQLFVYRDAEAASRKLEMFLRSVPAAPQRQPSIGNRAYEWRGGNTCNLCFRVDTVTVNLGGVGVDEKSVAMCEGFARTIADAVQVLFRERGRKVNPK